LDTASAEEKCCRKAEVNSLSLESYLFMTAAGGEAEVRYDSEFTTVEPLGPKA